jgi:hypothetical protein
VRGLGAALSNLPQSSLRCDDDNPAPSLVGTEHLTSSSDLSPEGVAANFAQISDRTGEIVPQSGGEQSMQAMKLLQARS